MIFLLFGINRVFAQDNMCVKLKTIENIWENKEDFYEYIKFNTWLSIDDINWDFPIIEAIKYYMNCFTEDEKEYMIYNDILFFAYYYGILKYFDDALFYNDADYIILIWNKALNDLEIYWKNNINYEYYLGRYNFFLWMSYYYIDNYKKAIEYISIAHKYYKTKFKYPSSFSDYLSESYSWKTLYVSSYIQINTWNDIINKTISSSFLTNSISAMGNGWRKYEWKYRPYVSIRY